LIHTDVGVNLVGSGGGLRLIDWQCPAVGDICEGIYSFLSPAFQILGERPQLSDEQIKSFWDTLDRPDLARRYSKLRAAFARAIALGEPKYWTIEIFVTDTASP
jgi:thiamine kinase